MNPREWGPALILMLVPLAGCHCTVKGTVSLEGPVQDTGSTYKAGLEMEWPSKLAHRN